MISQIKFLIVLAAVPSFTGPEVSFAQLQLKDAMNAPLTTPNDGTFAGTADDTLDIYIAQSTNGVNEIDFLAIAQSVLSQWEGRQSQTENVKSTDVSAAHNWPKWIVKKSYDADVDSDGLNLQATLEVIFRVGCWYRSNDAGGVGMPAFPHQTHSEAVAREFLQVFINKWVQRVGIQNRLAHFTALANQDQFLIQSDLVQVQLGDVDTYANVAGVVNKPATTADVRIYQLNVNLAGNANTGTATWDRLTGMTAHAANDLLVKLCNGFRSELAYHIVNGAHEHDRYARWSQLLQITNAVWGKSLDDVDGVQVSVNFKISKDINTGDKMVLVRNKASGEEQKRFLAVERHLNSATYLRVPTAFKAMLYGNAAGPFNNAGAVFNNAGVVHKLFTRHAFSCANAAKSIGDWRVRSLPWTTYLKQSVLEDARLSDLGMANSAHGGARLAAQCVANNIPPVSKVFTSTMRRTVETAHQMVAGMVAYGGSVAGLASPWAGFAAPATTIMPGIKEIGGGAENRPNANYGLNIAAGLPNAGLWSTLEPAVRANVDNQWVEAHNNNWAGVRALEDIHRFTATLGENAREHFNAPNANVAEDTYLIVTHSGQMTKLFSPWNGYNKPENNDSWKFDYVRMPGAAADDFILVAPIDNAPTNASMRVGAYNGYRQRDAAAVDVGGALGAVAARGLRRADCARCDEPGIPFNRNMPAVNKWPLL